MPLLLRPATEADALTLTSIFFSAFAHDAIALLVFPPTAATRDWWTTSIISELHDATSHFLCVYDSDSPTPHEIVAYAKWHDPAYPTLAPPLPPWPAGGDHDLGDFFFGKLFAGREKIMKDRKHWYLEFIATRREWQGKGVGGMLIRWGLERSDREGTETYLEASPEGLPIYKRFGFEEVETLVVDLKGKGKGLLREGENEFVEVFMVRPVKKEGC